ncbi:TRAP-type C4-dicarboxylate transport system, small permease component [Streptococcus merionis]|uniref:TRAP-type C4-dicarboxylate transport system, small permease component n=1 Tax=Streptococcus merionis TaxID=400065 RepID=A0A239SMR0_9STRE|nr:TRAP-type C4-dicarboxylate transport system, small permease component [Streptococcus merionis]
MIAIRKLLDKCLEFICSVVFVVMILVVLYQIFVRTVLGNPNTVTEEFVKFSLVVFACFSLCRWKKVSFISIPIIRSLEPTKAKNTRYRCSNFICSICSSGNDFWGI